MLALWEGDFFFNNGIISSEIELVFQEWGLLFKNGVSSSRTGFAFQDWG